MTYGDAVDQNLRLARKMLEQQAEVNRLRAECAALADALDEDRHEFDGLDMEVVDRAGATRTATVCASTAAESRCRRTADHRVHRTSAVVRAGLGTGAP